MQAATKTPNPLKWHGGKVYLAPWIISLMPPHIHYVEPFAGGLSVLLAKDPEGVSEVVNDLNLNLTVFWSVLRSDDLFARLQRLAQATPFSRGQFEASKANLAGKTLADDAVDTAWNFFVACRQSLAGRMKGFTGVTKIRVRRGMNNEVSAWLTAIEGLPAVHERLKRVLILNRPAMEVIAKQDGPATLFYLDPPYLHGTRATTGEYACEMSDADHSKLLDTLSAVQGKFLLSGYHSAMYDGWAERHGYCCHEKTQPNHAAGGKAKRQMTECVWTNF